MTEETVEEYIRKLITHKIQTSYKLYFLLAVLELGKQYDELSFVDCGREMLVQAWNDISNTEYHFAGHDKMIEIKNDIVYREGILEYCSEKTIRQALASTTNKETLFYFSYLTIYCPYLLLSYGQWNETLKKERNYSKTNRLIAELSQTESCLYEIHKKTIILNSEYFDVINKNTDHYVKIVREELKQYLLRQK